MCRRIFTVSAVAEIQHRIGFDIRPRTLYRGRNASAAFTIITIDQRCMTLCDGLGRDRQVRHKRLRARTRQTAPVDLITTHPHSCMHQFTANIDGNNESKWSIQVQIACVAHNWEWRPSGNDTSVESLDTHSGRAVRLFDTRNTHEGLPGFTAVFCQARHERTYH